MFDIIKTYKSYSKKSLTKPEDVIVDKHFNLNSHSEGSQERVELLNRKMLWKVELREKPIILTTAYGLDKHSNDVTDYFEGLFEWQFRYKTK